MKHSPIMWYARVPINPIDPNSHVTLLDKFVYHKYALKNLIPSTSITQSNSEGEKTISWSVVHTFPARSEEPNFRMRVVAQIALQLVSEYR